MKTKELEALISLMGKNQFQLTLSNSPFFPLRLIGIKLRANMMGALMQSRVRKLSNILCLDKSRLLKK